MKETILHGRKVIFVKDETITPYDQCPTCAFYPPAGCPKSNNKLDCEIDPFSVWKYKEDVSPSVETQEKPPEAPAGRKYDLGKPMYALVPVNALEEVVKVLTAGAIKYNEPLDEENWRKVDNPYFRYFSAAQRHMAADRKGELIDEDKVNPDGSLSKGTDCYHLACAVASLMFMLQLRMEENEGT